MPISYTIDRYVSKKLLHTTALFILIGFFFTYLVEFLELYRQNPHSFFLSLLKKALFKAPYTLFSFLPLLLFLGAITATYRLHNKGEITALKSNGISSRRILVPLAFMGLLLGAGRIFFFHPIGVLGMRTYLLEKENLNTPNASLQLFRSGIWAQKTHKGNFFFLHAKTLPSRNNAQLRTITLHITNQENGEVEAWYADKGWLLNKKLFLSQAWQFHPHTGTRFFPEKTILCPINLPELVSQSFHPSLLYFWSLSRLMRILEDISLVTHPYKLMWQKMFASIFDCCLLVVIGGLLGMQQRKRRSSALLIGASTTCGFLFYALQHILFELGKTNQLSFFAAIWSYTLVLSLVFSILILVFEERRKVY